MRWWDRSGSKHTENTREYSVRYLHSTGKVQGGLPRYPGVGGCMHDHAQRQQEGISHLA